jgi:TPR repeat protein
MSNLVSFPRSNNRAFVEAIGRLSSNTAESAVKEFGRLLDAGCQEAYSVLGALYELGGVGVEQDFSKAHFYYERALDTSPTVQAYLGLARLHFFGHGVEQDCCKALEYCITVLEQDNDAQVHFYAGRIYLHGCCEERDLEKAKQHFWSAWEQGYVYGLTYYGVIQTKQGYWVTGWLNRFRAAWRIFRLSRVNPADSTIREPYRMADDLRII